MRYVSSVTVLALLAGSTIFQQNAAAAPQGPCDIYEAAGTPCVAAYSTVRALSSKYTGPLYQVRRSTDKQTKDIPQLPDGFADSKVQDDFLGSNAGTISRFYDQSGKGNDLTVAKKGSYTGTASQDDRESNAKAKSLNVNGHKVYALYTNAQEGYRAKQENYSGYPAKVQASAGMPTGNQPQGIYALEDGSRPNVGCCCCFDFGNASLDNAAGPTGAMNTLFFGIGYWGKGAGNGPWFLNDMEAGVWAGGSGASGTRNNNLPSSNFDYAFGITKTSTINNAAQYAIRVASGSATSGASINLVTAYDGKAPSTWKHPGGIVLGIGGDNSNSSSGTFYEGCITAGRPSDETDALILKNVQAARYGSTTTAAMPSVRSFGSFAPLKVTFNNTNKTAVFSYSLQNPQSMSLKIFNQQGRQVAKVIDGVVAAGQHEVSWNAKMAPSGVYIAKVAFDGRTGWTGTVITKN